MIREERPGKDGARLLLGELREARDNVGPVDVILENDPSFEIPHHHMVEGSGGIEARLSGHGERSRPQLALLGNVPYMSDGRGADPPREWSYELLFADLPVPDPVLA